jgi:hypothetical protein
MGTNWYFMAHTCYRPMIRATVRSAQAFVQIAAIANVFFWRRREYIAGRLFASLPAKERAAIEAAAHTKAPSFGREVGRSLRPCSRSSVRTRCGRTESYEIPTFDQWCQHNPWQ